MSNVTTTNMWVKLQSEADVIDLVQSSVSLIITLMIFFKVFDLSSLRKSIRDKRTRMKREKERKDYENLKKLFASYQNGEDVSAVTLTDDEAEEKKDDGPMRIARKKKPRLETSV
jgi:hypothetical protein